MQQEHIRNFAIIAHIDHGKSTLSDRFLEITHTITKEKLDRQEQFLDQNPISRERGITIKLAPVRMYHTLENTEYMLNLIDTPGHVDFSYEVSRTLAACEGVVLLIDATKGIQAQTVAHFKAAKKQNIVIIPVINKIDMENAYPEKVAQKLQESFGFLAKDIHYISAKTGKNVTELLEDVIRKIPSPQGITDAPLRALVFDAVYDEHKGVVAFVRIIDGSIGKNNAIELYQTHTRTTIIDVGYFAPSLFSTPTLVAGEIGYIVTGIKNIKLCRIGDTIINSKQQNIIPLPGYQTPKSMVFFGIYPKSTDDLIPLRDALQKLSLIDASLTFHEEYSMFLGNGFRVGFLGLLHAEIVKERLVKEFNLEPLFTLPHVMYEKQEDGSYTEPYIHMTIHVPQEYIGNVMTLAQKKRAQLLNMNYQDTMVFLDYEMPYGMFIRGFSADLKSVTAGFGSIDYEPIEYRSADLINLDIKINDVVIDVLSEFTYKDEADYIARDKAKKLKEALPRQQFRQIIQCVSGSRILAREEIPPYRKDVLAKMSGGDRTRKDKLLEAQKKGKSRLNAISKVEIPQDALFKLITS